MAVQKVGLTKLGLKKNTNLIPLEWNDQVIEIKQYLPIEDKIGVIERIVNQSLDDNNFANPARIMIHTVLEIMFVYTNINFTDKQKEDKLALYDLLVGSGLWDKVKDIMLSESKDFIEIESTVQCIINEIYSYKNSALGILQAIQTDYRNLNLDAESLADKMADENTLKLLRDIVTKLD